MTGPSWKLVCKSAAFAQGLKGPLSGVSSIDTSGIGSHTHASVLPLGKATKKGFGRMRLPQLKRDADVTSERENPREDSIV